MLLVWLVLVPHTLADLGPEPIAFWSLYFPLTAFLGTLDFGLAQGRCRRRTRADVTASPATSPRLRHSDIPRPEAYGW